LTFELQVPQCVIDGGEDRRHRVVGHARGVSGPLVADPEGRREGREVGLVRRPAFHRLAAAGESASTISLVRKGPSGRAVAE